DPERDAVTLPSPATSFRSAPPMGTQPSAAVNVPSAAAIAPEAVMAVSIVSAIIATRRPLMSTPTSPCSPECERPEYKATRGRTIGWPAYSLVRPNVPINLGREGAYDVAARAFDEQARRGISMNARRIVFPVLLALAVFAAQAQEPKWIGSWGASPLPPSPGAGPFPATPSFNDQTFRQIVRLSVGGSRVRLRLTNEYGAKAITIGAVHVALADSADTLKAGTEHAVTLHGRGSATIPAGSPLVSDPIDLNVPDLATLSVSLY